MPHPQENSRLYQRLERHWVMFLHPQTFQGWNQGQSDIGCCVPPPKLKVEIKVGVPLGDVLPHPIETNSVQEASRLQIVTGRCTNEQKVSEQDSKWNFLKASEQGLFFLEPVEMSTRNPLLWSKLKIGSRSPGDVPTPSIWIRDGWLRFDYDSSGFNSDGWLSPADRCAVSPTVFLLGFHSESHCVTINT